MDIRANKPVKHGFDHLPGGQDPIPAPNAFTTTYGSYAPALTAATLDPTIGSSGTSVGDWLYVPTVAGGPPDAFVVVTGAIDFTGTPGTVTPGTGMWSISVPYNIDGGTSLLGFVQLMTLFSSPDQLLPMTAALKSGSGDRFQFWYPATYPVGDLTLFDGSTDWTLADGDRLQFKLTYYTNDPVL